MDALSYNGTAAAAVVPAARCMREAQPGSELPLSMAYGSIQRYAALPRWRGTYTVRCHTVRVCGRIASTEEMRGSGIA
jgi:hypothetical protein